MTDNPGETPLETAKRRLANRLQEMKRAVYNKADPNEVEALKRRVDGAFYRWRDAVNAENDDEPRET